MPCHSHQVGHKLRAGWVAQELRGRYGDKHEYLSETPDLALVKAVIAHAARRAESDNIVVALTFGERITKREIFVELPGYVLAELRTTHIGKLRKALSGSRPGAASWGNELRKTRQLRSHRWHCVVLLLPQ